MFKLYNLKKDTYISKSKPTQNFGKGAQLYIQSGSNDIDDRTLVWFDTSEILADIPSGSLGDYTFKMRHFISDIRLLGNDFSVSCHPLSGTWDEGIGDEFITNIGTSWNSLGVQNGYYWNENEFPVVNDAGLIPWNTKGGDFDPNISYNVDIFEDEMVMETDITNYILSVNNSQFDNDGLIFIADKINYKLAVNSTESRGTINPLVISYVDNQVVGTGGIEYSGEKNNMLIKVLNYDSRVEKGQFLTMTLTIEERYRVAGFTYSRNLSYLDNIYYKIHYDVTNQELIPFSEFTKVSTNASMGGLFLDIDTEHMQRGSYWVQFKYDDGTMKSYSDKKYFIVE